MEINLITQQWAALGAKIKKSVAERGTDQITEYREHKSCNYSPTLSTLPQNKVQNQCFLHVSQHYGFINAAASCYRLNNQKQSQSYIFTTITNRALHLSAPQRGCFLVAAAVQVQVISLLSKRTKHYSKLQKNIRSILVVALLTWRAAIRC